LKMSLQLRVGRLSRHLGRRLLTSPPDKGPNRFRQRNTEIRPQEQFRYRQSGARNCYVNVYASRPLMVLNRA
jgi:hypothetical protein